MARSKRLRLGDDVLYTKGFLSASHKRGTVIKLEVITNKRNEKQKSVTWNKTDDRKILITLDNGEVVYGFQIADPGATEKNILI